jgi:acyl phosphate:glycerol-3-phosphate acyltransferase
MNRNRMPETAVLAASFAAGAVPFANIASTRLAGTDLRQVGSGTVSGSALFKVAGFWPLAVVGPLEVGKGALGPLLAGPGRPLLAAAAGTAAIAGHNFSPFLRGAGGRGLAPALGATLVLAPEGTGVLLAGLVLGRCARQTGLGCFLAYLSLGPILYRTRGRAGLLTAVAVVGPLLIKRLTGNKPPARRHPLAYLYRLIYDQDQPSAAGDRFVRSAD